MLGLPALSLERDLLKNSDGPILRLGVRLAGMGVFSRTEASSMAALVAVEVSTVEVGGFEQVSSTLGTAPEPVHRLTSSAQLPLTVIVICCAMGPL